MLHHTSGNLLDADTDALVNAVNTQGVMGKGIALQFKERFPKNYEVYRAACKKGELHPGKLLIVQEETASGRKLIINFPTKVEWRKPSQYEWVEVGLKALAHELVARKISSVAVPALGCGLGGLEWGRVKEMIERELGGLEVRVVVYGPGKP